MTNAAATQPGTTILQYAQTTDGQQILVPSNQVVVQGKEIQNCGEGFGLLKLCNSGKSKYHTVKHY